jgi:hypothetical protein
MNPIPRIALIAAALLLATAALATPARAAEFIPYEKKPYDPKGQPGIYMKNVIRPGDDQKFIAVAQNYKDRSILLLDSPGGHVMEAMNIGRWVRQQRWKTILADGASCTSGCALVWIAGVSRQLNRYFGDRIGLHSARTQDGKRADNANELVVAYLKEMGAPKEFIDLWLKAEPWEMIYIDYTKAHEWGLVD